MDRFDGTNLLFYRLPDQTNSVIDEQSVKGF
jgi:hypothetical protein